MVENERKVEMNVNEYFNVFSNNDEQGGMVYLDERTMRMTPMRYRA